MNGRAAIQLENLLHAIASTIIALPVETGAIY